MANLSNINDKFLFTDGDFLLIGGATANSISATESGVAIKNSNAATLSLQNSATNGKNHTLWSNTDGSFNITDVGVATRFTIASGGNVGIGVSSLQSWAKLQVAGTAGAQTGANQALYVTSPSTTAGEGVGIRLSAASGSNEAVGIIGMVNNSSGNSGSMTFHTYNGGADIPERMRIDSSGNVGIGETNIENDNKLHIKYSDANVTPLSSSPLVVERNDVCLIQTLTSNASDAGILFGDGDDNDVGGLFYLHGSDAMTFRTNTSEKMRISSGGTVKADAFAPLDSSTSVLDFATDNVIKLFTNSTERMRIDSSGVVRIGMTTDGGNLVIGQNSTSTSVPCAITMGNTNHQLDSHILMRSKDTGTPAWQNWIFGLDYSDKYFKIGDGVTLSGGNTFFTIDTSGNVGIGTASPSAKLEVRGTAPTYTNSSTVFWGGTTNNDSHNGIMLSSFGDALGGSLASNLLYSNSNTPTQTNTNRSSGQIKFGNTTVASKTSDINFGGYYKGTTTFVERVRIDGDGNVGIGRTSIAQPSSGATTLAIQGTSTTKGGAIRLYSSDDSVAAYIYPDNTSGLSINTSTSHPMVFRTAATERMRITSSGTVEIRNGSTVGGEIKLAGADNDLTINGKRGQVRFDISGTETYVMDSLQFYPNSDNAKNLGTSSLRWSTVYSANGVSTSDETLKENIKECDLGIDFIDSLKPKSYNLKDLKEDNDAYGKKRYGLIAQDILQTELKDSVFGKKDGEYGLSYNDLIAPMIKSIQELKAEIELLKTQINN